MGVLVVLVLIRSSGSRFCRLVGEIRWVSSSSSFEPRTARGNGMDFFNNLLEDEACGSV
jgi:hypothetical protein